MIPSRSDSDDDKYVPAGLLNSADNTLGRSAVKANEICEFYHLNKPVTAKDEKIPKETNGFVDLSGEIKAELPPKPASIPSSLPKPPLPTARRVLTIQPGTQAPMLPTDEPRTQAPPPRAYAPRAIQVPQNMYRSMLGPVPPPAMLPVGSPMYPQQRPIPYHPTYMPVKMPPSTILSQQAIINASIYGNPYMTPISSPMSAMSSMYSPGMVMAPNLLPFMHHPNSIQALHSPPHKPELEPIMPLPEIKPKISPETKKRLREEAAAKLKAERNARKALLKAQKLAEKAKNTATKKKKETVIAESGLRKFGTFSKDMFVIRLKDVDSFSRNNEIWRIDNHVMIQKFCGVPSIRAPARQFQSTNRLAGYDARATWRMFIINPDDVEIEKYGSEVTIHKFPEITVLREAKQLAEMKDTAFNKIEKSEYEEKMHALKVKQYNKVKERLRKRLERKQKKMIMKKMHQKTSSNRSNQFIDDSSVSKSYYGHSSNYLTNDEYVCRDVLNGLLDALDDEEYDLEGSIMSTDEGSCLSDEEEDGEDSEDTEEENEDDADAGSLISMDSYSDGFEDFVEYVDPSNSFPVYEEGELPPVAFEVVID
ncbi:Protein CBG09349 [Caenorhabditis briggsae]|uniref:Uncharacterized protein n=3 Tax=Caenorhabditis briggsae TaxID=6238 RepID=A0AAE9A314_CAEBR|nr:Protein CBG09349 [Caenorhabditis briggsae]ULT90008.1 hypothetical protein L3Y34_008416 [Caenorhabditis briggsae]CAP29222.1 Protein CBG09349 [Caenorhabditis briggsae]